MARLIESTSCQHPVLQVELAKDLALLLQAHFQHGPPPPLGMLGDDPTTIEELQERPEWVELTQCADLDAALAQLAGTELAEQVGGRAEVQWAGEAYLMAQAYMHRTLRYDACKPAGNPIAAAVPCRLPHLNRCSCTTSFSV